MKTPDIGDKLLIEEPTPKWMLPFKDYLALSESRLSRLQTREALFFSLVISFVKKDGMNHKNMIARMFFWCNCDIF